MANPKQPVALLEVKGRKHLTKNEIKERRESEVKVKSDNIEAPAYLPSNLKKRFDELAKELIRLEIMSNTDCDALARYIVVEYQFQKAAKKAMRMSAENPMYYDMLVKQEKLFKLARGAAADLGLTISSRCRLVVPKEDKKPENKFKQIMK